MSRRIITLTTDFGVGSTYVGQMKGAILSINPDVNLVDVSHNVMPQCLHDGARVLKDAAAYFPPETIHVAVIDPGVGTSRRIVYSRIQDQHYIAPDNGLLTLLMRQGIPSLAIELQNETYWAQDVSDTFHGRDIMGPVAAHVSLGVDPHEFGTIVSDLVQISWDEAYAGADGVYGSVVSFDSFGNLITDISDSLLHRAGLKEQLRIRCGSVEVDRLVRTYGKRPPGELVALLGSTGLLELAVVNGNAARQTGIQVGEEVRVTSRIAP